METVIALLVYSLFGVGTILYAAHMNYIEPDAEGAIAAWVLFCFWWLVVILTIIGWTLQQVIKVGAKL